jgi:hypothetical protein
MQFLSALKKIARAVLMAVMVLIGSAISLLVATKKKN